VNYVILPLAFCRWGLPGLEVNPYPNPMLKLQYKVLCSCSRRSKENLEVSRPNLFRAVKPCTELL